MDPAHKWRDWLLIKEGFYKKMKERDGTIAAMFVNLEGKERWVSIRWFLFFLYSVKGSHQLGEGLWRYKEREGGMKYEEVEKEV